MDYVAYRLVYFGNKCLRDLCAGHKSGELWESGLLRHYFLTCYVAFLPSRRELLIFIYYFYLFYYTIMSVGWATIVSS